MEAPSGHHSSSRCHTVFTRRERPLWTYVVPWSKDLLRPETSDPHLIRCDCIRWLPQTYPGRREGDTILSEMTGFCAWISCHLTNIRAVGYLFGKACAHRSFSMEYKNVRYRYSLNQRLSLSSLSLSPQSGPDAPHTNFNQVVAEEYLKSCDTANSCLHSHTRSLCSL